MVTWAAAASHQQALALFGDLGNRLGQADALNNIGELSSRTSSTGQAREHHNAALKIARDLSAPLEEARAPWKAPAALTSKTATLATPPHT